MNHNEWKLKLLYLLTAKQVITIYLSSFLIHQIRRIISNETKSADTAIFRRMEIAKLN